MLRNSFEVPARCRPTITTGAVISCLDLRMRREGRLGAKRNAELSDGLVELTLQHLLGEVGLDAHGLGQHP
jgi:hypothetical protein